MSSTSEKIRELVSRREEARLGGGIKRIEPQHAQGNLTSRDRQELRLDDGSFDAYDTVSYTHLDVYKRQV